MKWYKLSGLPSRAQWTDTFSQMYTISILDEKIGVLIRHQQVYAFREACPHAGKSLLNGRCTENNEIECPFHSFKFSLVDGHCSNSNEGYRLRLLNTRLNDEGDLLIEI